MGVDLRGHYEGLHLNWDTWGTCLRVARAFGWEPEGTQRPYIEVGNLDGTPNLEMTALYNSGPWGGSYFSNDYQGVTDTDAKALAAALDRAITAVETGAELSAEQHEALEEERDYSPISTKAYTQAFNVKVRGRPLTLSDTEVLRMLANFARHGRFAIG